MSDYQLAHVPPRPSRRGLVGSPQHPTVDEIQLSDDSNDAALCGPQPGVSAKAQTKNTRVASRSSKRLQNQLQIQVLGNDQPEVDNVQTLRRVVRTYSRRPGCKPTMNVTALNVNPVDSLDSVQSASSNSATLPMDSVVATEKIPETVATWTSPRLLQKPRSIRLDPDDSRLIDLVTPSPVQASPAAVSGKLVVVTSATPLRSGFPVTAASSAVERILNSFREALSEANDNPVSPTSTVNERSTLNVRVNAAGERNVRVQSLHEPADGHLGLKRKAIDEANGQLMISPNKRRRRLRDGGFPGLMMKSTSVQASLSPVRLIELPERRDSPLRAGPNIVVHVLPTATSTPFAVVTPRAQLRSTPAQLLSANISQDDVIVIDPPTPKAVPPPEVITLEDTPTRCSHINQTISSTSTNLPPAGTEPILTPSSLLSATTCPANEATIQPLKPLLLHPPVRLEIQRAVGSATRTPAGPATQTLDEPDFLALGGLIALTSVRPGTTSNQPDNQSSTQPGAPGAEVATGIIDSVGSYSRPIDLDDTPDATPDPPTAEVVVQPILSRPPLRSAQASSSSGFVPPPGSFRSGVQPAGPVNFGTGNPLSNATVSGLRNSIYRFGKQLLHSTAANFNRQTGFSTNRLDYRNCNARSGHKPSGRGDSIGNGPTNRNAFAQSCSNQSGQANFNNRNSNFNTNTRLNVLAVANLNAQSVTNCNGQANPGSVGSILPSSTSLVSTNQLKLPCLRPIAIDGSNVAFCHGKDIVFSCRGIEIAINYFLRRGHTTVKAFVPHFRRNSLPENQDRQILERLHRSQQHVVFTPSRQIGGRLVSSYDDRFVLEYAQETGAVIVSNDRFRDLTRENNNWNLMVNTRLLMYAFADDVFMVPQDPLGRQGPSLDVFLRF